MTGHGLEPHMILNNSGQAIFFAKVKLITRWQTCQSFLYIKDREGRTIDILHDLRLLIGTSISKVDSCWIGLHIWIHVRTFFRSLDQPYLMLIDGTEIHKILQR